MLQWLGLGGAKSETPPQLLPPKPTLPVGGFHRRMLPAPAVAFSTPAGKDLFKASIAQGNAEIFFRVSEAFRTQDEPAYCGLGTLVTVLNALEIDPGQIWKGSWRWYSEDMLDCCVDLEEVKKDGISWDEWLCLARCQGLSTARASRSEESSLDAFRGAIQAACTSDTAVLCVGYSRKTFGQAGDGHYSPIGAYEAASDHVLIMDVARFKHPPHWVPVAKLWEAMCRTDQASGRSRGFALLSRSASCPRCDESCLQVTIGRGRVQATAAFYTETVPLLGLAAAETAEAAVWRLARSLPPAVAALVSMRDPSLLPTDDATKPRLEAKRRELEATPLHRALTAAAAEFQARDGPLPAPIPSLVALLLVSASALGAPGHEEAGTGAADAAAAANADDAMDVADAGTPSAATTTTAAAAAAAAALRAALGPAAPLVLHLGGGAGGGDEAAAAAAVTGDATPCETFEDDVRMARAMLRDVAGSVESACRMEAHAACCNK